MVRNDAQLSFKSAIYFTSTADRQLLRKGTQRQWRRGPHRTGVSALPRSSIDTFTEGHDCHAVEAEMREPFILTAAGGEGPGQ